MTAALVAPGRVGRAVAVSHAAPGSGQWEADRDAGLGGSDLPVALSLSQWKTPTRLWLEKTGQVEPDTAGEAAEWGHRLQPVLLGRWVEDHPGRVVLTPEAGHIPSIVAHPDIPAARVSLDAATAPSSGPVDAVIEAKTAGAWQAGGWADGGIPRPYLAQALYQLAVTGLDVCYVPVLLAGQRYESRLIEADPRFTDWVLPFVAGWWQTHVVEGRQPPVDPVADVPLLAVPAPPEPDSTVVLGADVIARYTTARAAHDAAAAELDAAEADLKHAAGQGTHLLDDAGRLVGTWTATRGRAKVSAARVRELAPPELADQLITFGQPGRTLRWKKGNDDDED